jgi:hypothetical protein
MWDTHSLESVGGNKVRTMKGSKQVWGTDFLDSAEGVTSQNSERK